VLETFYANHPPKRTPEGMTVPIIKIRTPARPTIKGMAELMLSAFGEKYFVSKTENALTHQVHTLLKNCDTKAILIDEFNHFVDSGSGKMWYLAADWLKELADSRQSMLVVSGLERCRAVINTNEQLRGRFLNPVVLSRFQWTDENDSTEFIGILEAFHRTLSEHFDMPDLTSSEMAFRFFCASGGLIGYVAKILRQAVWDAKDDKNRRTLTMKHFAIATKNAIWEYSMDSDMVNPFSKGFTTIPNAALLSQVAEIGTRTDDEDDLLVPAKRPRMPRRPSLNQVLSAKGD